MTWAAASCVWAVFICWECSQTLTSSPCLPAVLYSCIISQGSSTVERSALNGNFLLTGRAASSSTSIQRFYREPLKDGKKPKWLLDVCVVFFFWWTTGIRSRFVQQLLPYNYKKKDSNGHKFCTLLSTRLHNYKDGRIRWEIYEFMHKIKPGPIRRIAKTEEKCAQ